VPDASGTQMEAEISGACLTFRIEDAHVLRRMSLWRTNPDSAGKR